MSCASQPLISHFEVHCWKTGESHPSTGPGPTEVSRGRLTPGRMHTGLGPTVILTDWCNKNLTSLSQTAHHRPVLAGEGKGREGLGVGDTDSVVCVPFRRGVLWNSGRSPTLFIVTLIRHLLLEGAGQTAGAHLTGTRLVMHKQANFKLLVCEGLNLWKAVRVC